MASKFIMTVLCLFVAQHLFSQDIKGVVGRWAIVNITPEQARELAIEEAKKEALRRAGVTERIRATDVLSTLETNNRSNQLFSSFSSIELNGAVTQFEVVKDEREINSLDGQLYAVVTIDATVKKYETAPDPEFKFNVSGLKSLGYVNGENIVFSVHPNKEGYLKIFLFENSQTAAQVFPNQFETNRLFRAKETVNFPTIVGIDYRAEKSTTDRLEQNWLLLVYTKKDIPFYGETNFQTVLNWVNTIELNEREVIIESILISER